MVVIVMGLPGSGKSYFAIRAAKMLNAVYISSDKLRKEMFVKPTYSSAEKLCVYNKMLQRATGASEHGKDVVLDATFYSNDLRQIFINEAKSISRAYIIEVYADENLVKERLSLPREDSDADFEVYKAVKKEWEPFNDEHLVLDSTNDDITEMLERVADYLFEKK